MVEPTFFFPFLAFGRSPLTPCTVQPIWKICSSNWESIPQGSGWKEKMFETTTKSQTFWKIKPPGFWTRTQVIKLGSRDPNTPGDSQDPLVLSVHLVIVSRPLAAPFTRDVIKPPAVLWARWKLHPICRPDVPIEKTRKKSEKVKPAIWLIWDQERSSFYVTDLP